MKKPRKATAAKAPNPFELHINKQKMSVLGQKTKSDRGLPGVSRAKAIKKRKHTLLREYKLQHKSNMFTDRRIGESNRTLDSEEKLTARFTAIRMKAQKKSIFNLADDEVLTHRGQTLSEIEKFDDPRSEDEDDDMGVSDNLDANFVEEAHFGGGILKKTGIEGAKSHRELINELIAESKKRKAEKQRLKEATLELTEKLDTEWKDLLPLVGNKSKTPAVAEPQVDDYDKVLRELKFEARGTVSDRLKTEEEIVKEEMEQLATLERERKERMQGLEENHGRSTYRSADDLDEDIHYESDPEYTLSYNQEGESNVEVSAQINGKTVQTTKEDENGTSDNADEEVDSAEEDEPSDDESDDLSDLKAETSEESDDDEMAITENKKNNSVLEEQKEEAPELPYTFDLPVSYEALESLLQSHSLAYQNIIIERMIKCNHPSLAEKNKENIKILFAYLLQYINDCTEVSPDKSFEVFKVVAPHLFQLAQLDKENAASSIKEVVKEKHEEYRKHKKNYPGLEVLLFLKLVGLLFPTSDFHHPVVTPCFVFIEQMLGTCRVKTRKDVAYGLFLVTIVLEYTTLSKRYLPAAINYLGGILHMAIPKTGVRLIKVNPPFQSVSSTLVLVNKSDSIDMKMQPSDLVEETVDDSFKIRTIYTVVKLIGEFHINLTGLSSNAEVFKDIMTYMELLPIQNYPKAVSSEFSKTLEQLKSTTNDRKLQYIVMPTKRPKALRLYEPKIEPVFDGKRRRVQSREKAEQSKLVHKLKKETKGALREIRRDKSFLGRVKIQQRIRSDNERKDKVKRIYAEASIQQSQLNSLDRKKKQ